VLVFFYIFISKFSRSISGDMTDQYLSQGIGILLLLVKFIKFYLRLQTIIQSNSVQFNLFKCKLAVMI